MSSNITKNHEKVLDKIRNGLETNIKSYEQNNAALLQQNNQIKSLEMDCYLTRIKQLTQ